METAQKHFLFHSADSHLPCPFRGGSDLLQSWHSYYTPESWEVTFLKEVGKSINHAEVCHLSTRKWDNRLVFILLFLPRTWKVTFLASIWEVNNFSGKLWSPCLQGTWEDILFPMKVGKSHNLLRVRSHHISHEVCRSHYFPWSCEVTFLQEVVSRLIWQEVEMSLIYQEVGKSSNLPRSWKVILFGKKLGKQMSWQEFLVI